MKPAGAPPDPGPAGLRLIVAYKLVKALLQAVAAVGLAVAVKAGIADKLAAFALALAAHAVHPAAVQVARWLSLEATPAHLHVLIWLLGADALLSAGEGWVLRRGYAWGRWLVVLATGSLLPFELYELVVRPGVGRVVLFLVNAAIVVYLAVTAARHRVFLPRA